MPIKNGAFNPSFLLPIVDLVVFMALFVGAAYWHYNEKGVVQIASSEEEVRVAEAEYAEDVASYEEMIVEEKDRKEVILLDHQAKQNQVAQIEETILVQHEKIQDGKKLDADLTTEFVSLRRSIEKSDSDRRTKQADILERREEIRGLESDIAVVQAEVADSVSKRNAIESDITALHQERERDPISIFPPGAAIAGVAEVETDDTVFGIALSGVLKEFGNINVGLAGNLALTTSGASNSVKEGGFFANIPIAFRRASLDLETGLASVTSSGGSSDLAGYLGATVRYAPIRKERFFLLGGTKYRDDALSLRFGVAFGRR